MSSTRPRSVSLIAPNGETITAPSIRALAKIIGVKDTRLLRFLKRNPDQGQVRLKKLRGFTITATVPTQEQAV